MAGLVYGLNSVGVAIGPSLGALGVAGFAIAFALQGILANIFAGVLIQIRRPFEIGHLVKLGDYLGRVDDVTLRTVVMTSVTGEQIIIPCATVIDETIENWSANRYLRSDVIVGVDYDADVDEAIEVLTEAMSGLDGALADRPEQDRHRRVRRQQRRHPPAGVARPRATSISSTSAIAWRVPRSTPSTVRASASRSRSGRSTSHPGRRSSGSRRTMTWAFSRRPRRPAHDRDASSVSPVTRPRHVPGASGVIARCRRTADGACSTNSSRGTRRRRPTSSPSGSTANVTSSGRIMARACGAS